MIKALYISAIEPDSGTIGVTLGLMELLKSRYKKVAFIKPIIKSKQDSDIKLINNHFNLSQKISQSYIYDIKEIEELLSGNKQDEIISTIISYINKLSKSFDFVLIQGLERLTLTQLIEEDINLTIAKNLSLPYISVLNGYNKSLKTIKQEIKLEYNNILKHHCLYFATFINKVKDKYIAKLNSQNSFAIPYLKQLDRVTLNDISNRLNAKFLYGKKK